MKFGLYYDLRNPANANRSYQRFYAEILEQVHIAEDLGYHQAWISEHHFRPDGYTSSPLAWATAFGMKTQRMRVGTNLLVLPLHNPIRVAEDAATLSLLTAGRFDLGIGAGFRTEEFEVFGQNIRHRPSLMEEGVAVLRAASTGTTLDVDGKRHRYHGIRVTPVPETPLKIMMGGTTPASVSRAARLADGFLATFDEHVPMYVKALTDVGKDAAAGRVTLVKWALVAEDPEREWHRVGERILYQINDYIEQGSLGPDAELFTSPQEILDRGLYSLWDASAAVREIVAIAQRYPQINQVKTWTVMPGEEVTRATARLEYFAHNVIPEVNRQLAAAAG